MTAIDTLKNEHRMIEQVLDCLEKIEAGARAAAFDTTSASEALEFLRIFADRCHHGKEEGALFPMLEARGMPRSGGPTGVMLYEHEQGRGFLDGMAKAIEKNLPMQFAENARNYSILMREHINKEDGCLFPMADHLLSGPEADTLLQKFNQFEKEDMGKDVHENYVELAHRLADRLGVARTTAPVVCGCHCSGGKIPMAACH